MTSSLALPILDEELEARLRDRMDEVEQALLEHVQSEAGFVTQAAVRTSSASGCGPTSADRSTSSGRNRLPPAIMRWVAARVMYGVRPWQWVASSSSMRARRSTRRSSSSASTTGSARGESVT
jgi:hypothetical protein